MNFEKHAATIKRADKVRAAQALVRYTYEKMVKENPMSFVNFVLGGMTYDQQVVEAETIVNDFKENAPWIKNDPEFEKFVKEFEKEKSNV